MAKVQLLIKDLAKQRLKRNAQNILERIKLKVQKGNGALAVDALCALAKQEHRGDVGSLFEIAKNDKTIGFEGAARLLWSAGKLRLKVDVDGLMNHHKQYLTHKIETTHLSNVAWALVFLRADATVSWQWVAKATSTHIYSSDATVASNLAWAAATLKVHSPSLVNHLKTRIITQRALLFTDYSRCTWSLAVLRSYTHALQEQTFRNTRPVARSVDALLKSLWVCSQIQHSVHAQVLLDLFERLASSMKKNELLRLLDVLPLLRSVSLGPSVQARVNKELFPSTRPSLDLFMVSAMYGMVRVGAASDYQRIRDFTIAQLNSGKVSLPYNKLAAIIKTFGITGYLSRELIEALLQYVKASADMVDTAWLLLEYGNGAFTKNARELLQQAITAGKFSKDDLVLLIKTIKKSGFVYPDSFFIELVQHVDDRDFTVCLELLKGLTGLSSTAYKQLLEKTCARISDTHMSPGQIVQLYKSFVHVRVQPPIALHSKACTLPMTTSPDVTVSILRCLCQLSSYPSELCTHLATLVKPHDKKLDKTQVNFLRKLTNDPKTPQEVRMLAEHIGGTPQANATQCTDRQDKMENPDRDAESMRTVTCGTEKDEDDVKQDDPVLGPTEGSGVLLREDTLAQLQYEEMGKDGALYSVNTDLNTASRLQKRESVRLWRNGIPPSGKPTPPGPPESYKEVSSPTLETSGNIDWLESNDKKNYMNVAPPATCEWVRCQVDVCGERLVLRLASNLSFLCHAWKARGGCCFQKSYVVSSGPENLADPQLVPMVLDEEWYSGKRQLIDVKKHAKKNTRIGTMSAAGDVIVFIGTDRQVGGAVDLDKYLDTNTPLPAGVVRATSSTSPFDLPVPPRKPSTAVSFHTSASTPSLTIAYESPNICQLCFRHPFSGFQAFATYLAWAGSMNKRK